MKDSKHLKIQVTSQPPKPDDESRRDIDMARLYDEAAESWVRDEPKVRDDLITWPLIRALIRRYGEGKTILDCGCGTGNVSRMVSPFAKSVIGIDISEHMIKQAEKHTPASKKIVYLQKDMSKLAEYIPPASIDVCLSIFGFCCLRNVDQLKATLQQIRQILKKEGVAIIQVPHPLDGFFKQPSSWLKEMDLPKSYFNSGEPVRRKLKTVNNDWLLVARRHFTMSNYVEAIVTANLRLVDLLEPAPSPEVLRVHCSLSREATVPSSVIFIATV